MGKSKTNGASTAPSSAFDPTLTALFASSSGPVTAPVRAPRTYRNTTNISAGVDSAKRASTDADETGSESGSEADDDATESAESDSDGGIEVEDQNQRPRKRRKVDQNEDLESKYLDKLVREEDEEIKQRKKAARTESVLDDIEGDASDSDSDLNSGLDDLSDSDTEPTTKKKDKADADELPKHESLTTDSLEAAKLSRTVFLGNVSTSCIKSKSAKKTLVQHLLTGLDTKHHEKIESIRFRSTAFVQDAGPKRAAYAKKELMDETMKSTNAYVVVSSDAAARKLASRLNGKVVLDRHLRVDNLGNPARIDHRRCVFVGNLSFVDEAQPLDVEGEDADGESKKRKRAREPADVEEGLWTHFGKCGKVESVRVVRDKETRISKGFAYVQFREENTVEQALLLHEKKFPPMLPRVLRVQRAKKEMKREKREGRINREPARRQAMRGRGGGRAGPSRSDRPGEKAVFEGHRATSNSMPKGLKKLKKRPAVKPTDRSSKRAAAFRAGHGKKKRDMET